MSEALEWLIDNAVDLIGLLTTVGLLAITFWYAKATREMATIAKAAAGESARATEAAERSAQAALDAATVAQSRIRVEFEGRTIALFTGGVHVPTVEIRSAGDPVVVQRVRARRAFAVDDDGRLQEEPSIVSAELEPVGEIGLPTRLHPDERLHLTHPVMNQERVCRFLLDIDYTFSERGGPGGTRQLIISEKA